MNRRGFLGSILALAAAPAIVRADSLMKIEPRQILIAGELEDAVLRKVVQLKEDLEHELLNGRGNLDDVIWDLEPMDSYFLSTPSRQKLPFINNRRGGVHQWVTDTL